MRILAFLLFILAILVTGVLGTGTALFFYWPGCLLLGLAGLVAGARWKMRIHFAPSDLCLGSIMLLAIYLVARAWWSPVVVYAREDIFIVLGCFVAYFLTSTVASHPRWRIALMALLVLLTVGNLVVGFIHFSGNWNFHVVPHFARTFGEGRIGGFYNNSNHLAAFLSFMVFLSAGLMCFGRGGASAKLLMGFLCIAAAIGMALTVSRGALVGLAGGGVAFGLLSFWIVWKTQRHIFGRLIVGMVLLVGLGGSVLYVVNREFQERRAAANPLGNDVRFEVWKAALDQHAMEPVTGKGSRMFYDYCMTLRSEKMPVYHVDPLFAHNEYLQMLADYGWIGLGLIALVVLAHVGHGLRFLRWFVTNKFPHVGMLQSNTLGFATGALGALAATMAHAIFEFHFHVAATAITGAVVMGILANPGFDSEVSRNHFRIPGLRPFSKLMLVAAALWMIGGAVWLGPADWWSAQAQIARQQEDMQARLENLDRSLERDPLNAEHFYERGLARFDQWKPTLPEGVSKRLLEKAAADFERATQLNPQHYLYATALTDALDRLGREADGLRAANLAVKAAPWHEEARLSLALHYHRYSHFLDAERAYLWAEKSRLRNLEGEFGWQDGYKQLLNDASGQIRNSKLE